MEGGTVVGRTNDGRLLAVRATQIKPKMFVSCECCEWLYRISVVINTDSILYKLFYSSL